MSEPPDLSGFPILRIDQISRIDSDTLADAQRESKELIQSLLAEAKSGAVPPMAAYLRKQNEAIASELLDRLAKDRISELLSGATSLLNRDRSKYIQPEDDDVSISVSTVSTLSQQTSKVSPAAKAAVAQPTPVFQPLPLPSERRKPSTDTLNLASVRASSQERSAEAGAEDTSSNYVSPMRRSESSPVGIAMSSRSTDRGRSTTNAATVDSDTESSSKASRRPLSGDIRPSRRSQQIINDNFGSMFIVAGEGRRRRPLPVKKVVEPIEEVKARERQERRKAAMQRLLQRKEERLQAQMVKKEKKRLARAEAEKAIAASEGSGRPPLKGVGAESHKRKGKDNRDAQLADPAGDSSGSESVSGGDDDMEVEVSAAMVSAVVEAQAQEASHEAEDAGESGVVTDGLTPERPQEAFGTHAQEGDQSERITFSNVKSPLAKSKSEKSIGTPSPVKPKVRDMQKSASSANTSATTVTGAVMGSSSPKVSKRVRDAKITSTPNRAPPSESEGESSPQRRKGRTSGEAKSHTPNSKAQVKSGASSAGTTPVKGRQAAETTDPSVSAQELEEKNSAALMSLRSMKLKKEQLRANSFKTALSFAESLALTPLDPTSIDGATGMEEVVGEGEEDPRCSTALSIRASDEMTVPDTERSMTAYSDPYGEMVTAEGSEDQVMVQSGMGGALVKSEKSLVGYVHADGGDAEVPMLEGVAPTPSSTIHIRESSLQVDADGAPVQPKTRPSTVPAPQSPSRWPSTAGAHCGAFDEFIAPGSPSRRRNSVNDIHPVDAQNVRESIDLSGETLEVDASDGKFTIPAASRVIADPTHRAVSQLLAGHAHSAVLYVQDGQYCARLGPDDLPGLCAWKLASIVDECANWVVNIAKYSRVTPGQPISAAHSAVFTRRATVRRSVSLGLLVLLLDTEDLLLGRARLFNAKHFTTIWREYIRLFDEKAEAVALQYGPQVLFTETAVCGNCHAVCKKLENLLKTLFVPRLDTTEGALHRALHAQEELLPPPSPREQDMDDQHAPTRDAMAYSTRASTADTRSYTPSEDEYASDAYAGRDPAPTARVPGSTNQSDADDTDLDGQSLLDEDDASIVPVYPPSLYNQFLAQQQAEKEEEESRLAEERALKQKGSAVDPEGVPTEVSAVEVRRGSRSKEIFAPGAKARSGEKAVALTTFYPTIGSLFPAVHSLLGARPTDDGSGAARVLIESMQVQCRMYEEWMEVMSDYSTVFSEGRGVAENHFDQEGGQEGAEDSGSSNVYKGGTRSLHYRVKSGRSEVNNIVTDVFNNFLQQWEELPAGLGLGLSWNILWTWSKPRIKMTHLLAWQRVNHYPDSKELTRKDLLKKNIQRYTNMGGKGGAYFDIMPQTFLLPHEYLAFVQAFTTAESSKASEGAQNFWILKPVGLSRGRGISLVKDLGQIVYSQSSVVQRYIERPLCLQGYKFDLRLYILVTSFKPLEAFIYRDGFARVSTHQYSLNPEDTENKFIHLTNSSIQSQNTDGISKDNPLQTTGVEEEDHDTGGSKISLLGANGLWKRLQSFGMDTAALWQSICQLVIKSLVIVDDKMVNHPCCFELFGYDVLVDADLRLWLLEVNASPSLARATALDVRVKNALIRDIIRIIDPAPFDRAAVLRVLQRRLGSIAKNRFTVGKNDPELEQDLRDILGDYSPRKFGELPAAMGGFDMLTPGTKEYLQVLKLKKKIIKS